MSRVTDQKLVIWIVAIALVIIMVGAAAYLYQQQEGPPTFATSYGLGQPGTKPGEFNTPTGVSVAPSGFLYVLEHEACRVQQLSIDGEPVAAWGELGAKEKQFDGPLRIANDGDGNLWIADTGNHRIQW
ncbi:MAG: hypothetical protein KC800_03455, partial [Candidatus Eremiobacteraeota bacterium]|nr:hypothetical protein [Candidatus Eremiobacteraeota bacterium]